MSSHARNIVHRTQLHFSDNDALREYYEQKYGTGGYDNGGYRLHGVPISALYHRRRQESALSFLGCADGQVVLDAGCGDGALAAKLAPKVGEMHAVDIAANALDPKFTTISNLHFTAQNIESLSYPDSHFDAVLCVETLEHLLHPTKALGELHRVLKSDGRLILTYPTINRTLMKRCRLGPRVPVSEHLNEWSYAELSREVRDVGFAVEGVDGISFDFGVLLALKHVNRFFAETITNASLAIRGWPGNSMFVAMRLRKA
jgi:ubiquinone/menaquinone biosynthesis C-methylase UbiE